jgi:SAM-dependent methyltransferase
MENLQELLEKVYKVSPYKVGYYNKTKFNPLYNETYGEVTQKSTNAIVNAFSSHFNENTVFYDLGCGLGKMVIHIGLQYNPKKSCGIEFSKERTQAAIDMKDEVYPNNDNISFIIADILKCDYSDATVIYLDNTMFDDEITKKIIDKAPKGCLFICRRLSVYCTDIEFSKLHRDTLATTYNKLYVFHFMK